MSETKQDEYINPFTGAGILGEDKSMGVAYATPFALSHSELEDRYRFDWLSRKVVSKPASDATKKFIAVSDGGDVMKVLNEIKAKSVIKEALIWARLFGGAAIVMVLEDGLISEDPLDLTKIKSIKSLEVVDRQDVVPLDGSQYAEPEFYRINNAIWHNTRVLRINGTSLSKNHAIREMGWGGSVLDSVDSAIKHLMIQYGNVAHIMGEHSVGVLKTKGFANAGSGGTIIAAIQARLNNLASSKSIYRTVMIDSEEDYDMATRSLTGLDDITNIYVTQVSAASEIPEMILFGKSQGALSSTDKEQVGSYYDMVSAVQTTADSAVSSLIEVASSMLNQSVPQWNWLPIGELTEAETADIRYKNAQALAIEVDSMQLSDEEARTIAKAVDFKGIYDDLGDEGSPDDD